jgi:CheY-like chemotaxis protein
MKILVAEDNTVTATLMTGILTRHGYDVVIARNGTEALSLLSSHPDIQGIITDIMMPGSSGLDLLRALQQHETWRSLPTIVTTVRDDPETVSKAASLGCREYILKPIRPARLVARLAKVFPQEKVTLESSDKVMSRYSMSPETYRKIAGGFAAQVEKAIADLQIAVMSPASFRRDDLIPLTESSTLLGAERLLAALEEASCGLVTKPSMPMQFGHLLEELDLVRKALSGRNGGQQTRPGPPQA